MRRWVRVAEVVKTKTLEGGLVVQTMAGSSFLLRSGMEVTFVPPRIGFPRRGCIDSIRPYKGSNYMILVDSIDNIDSAEALIGCSILAKREDLDAIGAEEAQDLIGYTLIDDEHAELGAIFEVIETSAQNVLRVQGVHGELLVPYVEEIVYCRDDYGRVMSTRIPKGLLDMALPKDAGKKIEQKSGVRNED